MSQTQLIKVALIGCGSFGAKRAQAISQCESVLLSRVLDAATTTAQELANKYNTQISHTLYDLIEKNDFDAAIVTVPNAEHTKVCTELLKAGKHVLCEKPLAHNLADAKQIALQASQAKSFFKLGSNLRFFSVVEAARELLKSGRLGPLRRIEGRIGHNGKMVRGKWNEKRAHSGGGALIDNGSHLIDLFSSIIGPLHPVQLISSQKGGFGDVEDLAIAELLGPNQIEVKIEASWSRESGYMNFTAVGEKADLLVDTQLPYLQLVSKNNQGTEKLPVADGKMAAVAELEYFFNCIRSGIPPEPSAEFALQTLKTIQRLYEIAEIH